MPSVATSGMDSTFITPQRMLQGDDLSLSSDIMTAYCEEDETKGKILMGVLETIKMIDTQGRSLKAVAGKPGITVMGKLLDIDLLMEKAKSVINQLTPDTEFVANTYLDTIIPDDVIDTPDKMILFDKLRMAHESIVVLNNIMKSALAADARKIRRNFIQTCDLLKTEARVHNWKIFERTVENTRLDILSLITTLPIRRTPTAAAATAATATSSSQQQQQQQQPPPQKNKPVTVPPPAVEQPPQPLTEIPTTASAVVAATAPIQVIQHTPKRVVTITHAPAAAVTNSTSVPHVQSTPSQQVPPKPTGGVKRKAQGPPITTATGGGEIVPVAQKHKTGD